MTTYNRCKFKMSLTSGTEMSTQAAILAELGELPENYAHEYTKWHNGYCSIGIDADDTVVDVSAMTSWKDGLSLTNVEFVEIESSVEHPVPEEE